MSDWLVIVLLCWMAAGVANAVISGRYLLTFSNITVSDALMLTAIACFGFVGFIWTVPSWWKRPRMAGPSRHSSPVSE